MLSYSEQLVELFPCRQRRRFQRGLKRKHMALLKRLRKAKKECPALEKPAVVKTHLRDMIIVPEMVGSMVGVYNGKTFNQVEVKVSYCIIMCNNIRILYVQQGTDLDHSAYICRGLHSNFSCEIIQTKNLVK